MNTLVERSEKTSDGLRGRLFQTLDLVMEGKLSLEQVEAVCALSDQIVNSARVELEMQVAQEELKRKQALRLCGAAEHLAGTEVSEDV